MPSTVNTAMREDFVTQTLARLRNMYKELSSQAGFTGGVFSGWLDKASGFFTGTTETIQRGAAIAGKAIDTLVEVSTTRNLYDDRVWGDWLDLAEQTERGMASTLGLSSDYSAYGAATNMGRRASTAAATVATRTAEAAAKLAENAPSTVNSLTFLVVGLIILLLVFKFAF